MPKRWRAAPSVIFMPPTGDKAVDDWIGPQRKAAIARIVKAVNRSPGDEMRLAADIYEADIEASVVTDPFGASVAKRRLKKVRPILKAVGKLDALITSDPSIADKINSVPTPFHIAPVKQLLLAVRGLENELVRLVNKRRNKGDLPADLIGRRPSEREWLVGVSLPLVYERHFGLRPARSRNVEGQPSGPMVRFIEATLRELGSQEYKPESIVRGFSRLAVQRNEQRMKFEER